jgi:hypothetical protein
MMFLLQGKIDLPLVCICIHIPIYRGVGAATPSFLCNLGLQGQSQTQAPPKERRARGVLEKVGAEVWVYE